MAKLKEQREAAAEKARAIAEGAKAAERALTSDEVGQIRSFVEEIKAFDEQIKSAMDADQLLASIGAMPESEKKNADGTEILSLGHHFVKHAHGALLSAKGSRFDIAAPEFKAASDSHLVTTTGNGLIIPEIDTNIVRGFRERLTIADWLGSGTLTSNAISYFVEKATVEGAFTTVAEGGAKPQLHFPDYDKVTETLAKIAGFIKISDEMTEDAAFLVTEIENRLLYQLRLFEEAQLLNGNGTGTNVRGILNRSGVQTEAAANNTDNADAIFRGLTKVQTATGLTADGIVINPIDYQKQRLAKDGNGQYFAGGFFAGQYGNGGILQDPPLWGKNTIVTSAIAAGTVLVGAGKQAATVYRKGGVRVEGTNTHGDDFTNNMVTIRAEERLALAVRQPAAFVKVTLSNAAPA
ncbi:HK97 family phage prohead protease [Arthrobacter sp. 9V]|uniref:phage major capsid protein n=1 Tax=Arthrobacter sp. 9V TaxID=2653132 RepID=UPI0012EF7EAE|nr:phage major capsid protein [Arthrobacter sp. 9V]VXB25084.1 HK97 family phage prohead protease [Arthrobacter sp. 9V]